LENALLFVRHGVRGYRNDRNFSKGWLLAHPRS
jgi:hypothetical protein